MRKIFLIGLFTILMTGLGFAQDPNIEKYMQDANELYQSEKYSEAIDLYSKIINEGYESSALYYNLANSYYRNSKLGLAILYYEKALKIDPDGEDIIHNLKIAKAHTVDKFKEVPELFLAVWWKSFVNVFTVTGWAVAVVIVFLMLLAAIGFYLLTKSSSVQKIMFYLSAVSLGIVILFSILLVSKYNIESSSNYGILTDSIISVKLSPDVKSNDAFVIHEGVKFSVEDELKGWVKIKLSDGKVGWLPKTSFEEI
ncbi:MAG: tetratricopeptide repeat protein [Rhodothermaceae bacterium]